MVSYSAQHHTQHNNTPHAAQQHTTHPGYQGRGNTRPFKVRLTRLQTSSSVLSALEAVQVKGQSGWSSLTSSICRRHSMNVSHTESSETAWIVCFIVTHVIVIDRINQNCQH